ncbi:MAG: 4Fe-4S binding protein [Eubacteriaceae bacterium]|nr:4Fe-4S binding protein [Eubacteriaceae bacterium]
MADIKKLKSEGIMQQTDGALFTIRLNIVGGHVEAEQLDAIRRASERYGNGYVHLTSRQNIEIPNVRLEDIESAIALLKEGGIENGVCGARVRTVTACQGKNICTNGNIDSYSLALEIAERYVGMQLPHKLKIGVSGCANNCLKAEENDIGIKGGAIPGFESSLCTECGSCTQACRNGAIELGINGIEYDADKCIFCGRCAKACEFESINAQESYLLYFGGMFGNFPSIGIRLGEPYTSKDDLFGAVSLAIGYYSENAQKGERLRAMLERLGWSGLKNALAEKQL